MYRNLFFAKCQEIRIRSYRLYVGSEAPNSIPLRSFSGQIVPVTVLEFLNNLWGARNRVGIGLSYRPGYTAWRNWTLGIDSWVPYKFKNSGSGRVGGARGGKGAVTQRNIIQGVMQTIAGHIKGLIQQD